MAIPSFSGPYTPQAETADDPVAFDVSAGWTGATSFEIDTLPPGFTFDSPNLGGFNFVNMNYTIFVRGVNADGAAPFEPLPWVVTGLGNNRTLYGLSLDYQNLHPAGSGALVYMNRATESGRQSPGGAGLMFINDIGDSNNRDGVADRYDSQFLVGQIQLNGVGDTFFRATLPGWEIIIDTNV